MAYLGVPIKRGKVVTKHVPIGETLDGSSVTIPVMTIGGFRSGPTLFVQAGLHGNEQTGIEIGRLAIAGVSAAKLSGNIVYVPVANVPAYLTRSRGYLHEERPGIDINRIFPGNSGGLLTERIAYALLAEFVDSADATIDLHSALDGCNMYPYVSIKPDDDINGTLATREALAIAFGAPLIYRGSRGSKMGTSDMAGSLQYNADRLGKPSLAADIGESRRITEDYLPIGVRGVTNVLKAMDMLPGKPETDGESLVFRNIHLVHATRGGGLRLQVRLGETIAAGQSLGDVVDMFGAVVEELKSPAAGTVLRLMVLGAIATGAEVAWIVN